MNSIYSQSDEEESKWAYFRSLRDATTLNEDDENLRKLIAEDIDQTKSSVLSDEMNAMERTLKLGQLRDTLTDNIFEKIACPKDRMLVALLYKVCNDLDPTRMQFIRLSILLHQHGILKDLDFLTNAKKSSLNKMIQHHHHKQIKHTHNDFDDEWSDEWSDDDEEEPQVENAEDLLFNDQFSDLNVQHLDINDHHDTMDEKQHGHDDEEQIDKRHDNETKSDYHHQHEKQTDLNPENMSLARLMSSSYSKKTMPSMISLSAPIRSVSMNEMTSRYHRDFEELETVGYGAFGTVHRVKHKLDGGEYAIKKILYKHNGMNHEEIKREIIREVTNIATLNHDNIVRYFSSWIEPVMITMDKKKDRNHIQTQQPPPRKKKDNENENERENMDENKETLSFFDYEEPEDKELHINSAISRLNPTGSIPIIRSGKSANEELQILLSSDAAKSLISPYASRHTSPSPVGYKTPHKSYDDVFAIKEEEKFEHNLMIKKKAEEKVNEIYKFWQNQTNYSCLFLQTEFCGHYTLKDFINNKDRIPNRDDNMRLFSQIILGVAHIHSKLLLHRDLKPENIFLVQSKNTNSASAVTVKIGDFGLSKSICDTLIDTHLHYEFDNTNLDINDLNDFLGIPSNIASAHQSSSNLTRDTGTGTYAAPEQLLHDTYGTAADIYSLGIILFELIQPAFDTMMERRIAIARFRENHEIDEERIDRQQFGAEIELMMKMTQKDANLRPPAKILMFDQLIQIYWMRKVLSSQIPAFPESQRSLEYTEDAGGNAIEVEMVQHKGGDEKGDNNQSPSFFVISSPNTPPNGLLNHKNGNKMSPLIMNNANKVDQHTEEIKVRSLKIDDSSLLEHKKDVQSCSL